MNGTRDLLKRRPRQPEGAGVGALAGLLAALCFAFFAILVGIAMADWWAGATPFSVFAVMTPPGAGCVR